MQGQFRHLHFKTFSTTSRTPQCKVFWPFNSSSEFLGVPEDSKFPLLGVWVSPSHLAQSGVATFNILHLWIMDVDLGELWCLALAKKEAFDEMIKLSV
jgi:hypothetical protein